ncbi:hypothetical protein JHK82_023328 [Glycine max]|nr:hypothetical protein JHK87_023270 [Glycine soja]KAG5138597.1 hypothetical protein JHK82_023328 [Glycine max]
MLIFARCLLGGSWWTLEDKKEILRCGVFLIIVRRNRKEKGLFFVLVLLFEMNEYTGPARRTRSKGVEVRGGLIRSRKRRRVVDYDDDELVFVKELKGGGEGASAKIEKSMERGFEFLGESEDDGPFEVVEIDEDDDEAEEEVYGECEQKKKRVEVKVEEKDEGPEVLCYVAAEKVASFGGGDDDECGSRPENPVVMLCVSDDGGGQSEEDHGRDRSSVSSDDGFGSSSSSSSEDDDSSDDDFKVGVEDERADDEEDYSSIEEESESDDDSSCDDERGELYKKFVKERVRNLPDSDKDDPMELEEKDGVVVQGQTQPLACGVGIPLTWDFLKKNPVEKSEAEKELDMLWAEMEMLLRAGEIGIQVDEARAKEENPALQCKHDTIFNEEIGVYCRWCGWIATEIKYIMPPFVDSKRSGREAFPGAWKTSQFDGATFDDCGDDSGAAWSHNEGTVWDIISDIKKGLFPHQQEGFEFIWTSLAGTTNLAELKRVDPGTEGGCIISHAPGTGKTKLTMVFLQTYLQLFPKCLPVIIAPANILLTWEDELRKWNIGIPFHNLNNAELSGKENVINEFGYQELNKDAIRMLKLCSWYKEKSILLISYNLYEKLAGGKSEDDGEKEKKNRKIRKEKKRASIETAMGKVLRDYPGLLVLDEGHTPRNQRSCIWKVLSESRSQKRILLSGTPFQNNFLELFNIFCLMKPSFSDNIPQELKKFCQSKLIQERKASKDVSWESINSGNPADEKIKQLKLLMNPFVHVHKGSILQKNLLGLQDCVLILKPEILQQKILDSIECSQNGLNFEHKLALVSVHPSLFLNCSLSKKEESVIDMDQLKKCRLDSYEGVKTKFLMEFVNLCDAVDEKVLVFSQFIDTLILIKDQLESAFNWSEGREVLFMHGRVDQKQKQSLIHSFNDANSQAKVLLASIKASSEGINLVGASRVVLLDVVWNPSVERQAICRAYRLGQKKVVYTYHLLAQGTPECTKYCKQAEKNRLSELVFSNRNAESDKLKRSGVIEDKVLDAMVQHEKLKDIFGECLVQPKEGDQETLCP